MRGAMAEGLDRYDVQRGPMSNGKITRPALVVDGIDTNWMPQYQVHLEGDDVDRKEAQRLSKYYTMKAYLKVFG